MQSGSFSRFKFEIIMLNAELPKFKPEKISRFLGKQGDSKGAPESS